MTCNAFSGTGVSTTVTHPTFGALSPMSFAAKNISTISAGVTQTCMELPFLVNMGIWADIRCDPSCTADPTISLYSNAACSTPVPPTQSITVNSIDSYTCGDPSDSTCATPCQKLSPTPPPVNPLAVTPTPVTPPPVTGSPVTPSPSAANSLRSKIFIGIVATFLATVALM